MVCVHFRVCLLVCYCNVFSSGWIDASSNSDDLVLCKLSCANSPQVLYSLTVRSDLSWVVHYCGRQVCTVNIMWTYMHSCTLHMSVTCTYMYMCCNVFYVYRCAHQRCLRRCLSFSRMPVMCWMCFRDLHTANPAVATQIQNFMFSLVLVKEYFIHQQVRMHGFFLL